MGRKAANIAAVALTALLSLDAADAAMMTLRYGAGYSTIRSIYSLPILIARDQGIFAQEGIKIDIIVPYPGGEERMITALYDNTVDVTHVATPFLIKKVLAGSDVAAIAAEMANPIYSLVAKPEIKTYADLRGRLLGLADERGSIAIAIRKLMAMHGIKRGDVRVRTIGGTPSRYACLKRGECDAVALGQPQDIAAAAAGYTVLGRSTQAVPDYLYTVTAVRRGWARAHRHTVIAYVRGLAHAFGFIRDAANRATVVHTIVKATGVTPAIAAKTMALYLDPDRGVLPKRGEISLKGLAAVLAMMAKAGKIKPPLPQPQGFVDLSYLHAAGIE